MARGLDPAGTGQHDGIHTGTKQRGNTTGNQTGGNNEKMRNVTFILGYMDYMWLYGLYVVLWVMWVICGYYPQSCIHIYMFLVCFIHNHFSNIQWFIFKTSIAERNFHLINRSPSFRKCSTGTFQTIANNIYIMEMPILGLMIPKKNAAVCNGITIVLCEMEGCNMAPKFKGFLPRFPRWAVYEMMLVFPFHTGHGFFHSIQVQSRGICSVTSGQLQPLDLKLLGRFFPLDRWKNLGQRVCNLLVALQYSRCTS